MKFSVKSVGVAAVVVAWASLLPAPAQAQALPLRMAEVVKETVYYDAASGARNDVVITRSGRTVTIDDRVAISAGRGCYNVPGDATKVRCTPVIRLTWIAVDLKDQNDKLVNRTNVRTAVLGGSGNDRITGGTGYDGLMGGSGNDVLNGGKGNDIISGEAGNDTVDGGPGNDTLNADAGRDVLRGGTGRDLVSYGIYRKPVSVDLDGARGDDGARGEGDTVGSDVEDLVGTGGNDRLVGNSAHNRIYGAAGKDYISGLGGHDILDGQTGNDTIYGGTGNDHLIGGPGKDKLYGGSGTDRIS